MIRFVVASLLSASVCAAGEAGRESLLFMRLTGDARSGALGSGAAALTEGDSALFGNPAGAVLRRQLSVSDTVLFWPVGFFGESLVGQWPIGRGGIVGASLFLLHHEALPVTTEAQPDGTGSLAGILGVEMTFMASTWISETLAFGTNARLVHEKLGEVTTLGEVVDVGMIWAATPENTVGITFRPFFGWAFRSSALMDAYPSSLDLSYRFAPPELPIRGYLGWRYRFAGLDSMGVGLELGEVHGASVRSGIGYRGDGRAVPSAGIGMHIDVWHFDYTLAPVGDLGYMNRLTLAVRFGSARR